MATPARKNLEWKGIDLTKNPFGGPPHVEGGRVEAGLRDIPRLAWYLELLAFLCVGLGVVLLGVDAYLAGAEQQLSELGTEAEGVESTLSSAVAVVLLLGVILLVCGGGCWYLSHRIQRIMEESSEELRAMEVRRAAREAPRE